MLKIQIDSLLAKGNIQPCQQQSCSFQSESIRLCEDYRKLNDIIISDTYSLLYIDAHLHQAKITEFKKTLDLNTGYHQVNVFETHCVITAFV